MRIAALLLISVGVLWGACTPADPPDEQCIVAGGVCFKFDAAGNCPVPLDAPCGSGYTCCQTAYGGNIGIDGALIDAPTGAPDGYTADTGVDAALKDGASKDGQSDAPHEAGHDAWVEAHAPDAHGVDATVDATLDHEAGAHDAGLPKDAGHEASKADAADANAD